MSLWAQEDPRSRTAFGLEPPAEESESESVPLQITADDLREADTPLAGLAAPEAHEVGQESIALIQIPSGENFNHELENSQQYSTQALQKRMLNVNDFQIPETVAQLFFQLLDRAEARKARLSEEDFADEVREGKLYVQKIGVGRAELTNLDGQYRIRVKDEVSQESWFFFLKTEDDVNSAHAQKIKFRQWIMSGADKFHERRKLLHEEFQKEQARWFQFFKRYQIARQFKDENFRKWYLPGRDTNFVELELENGRDESRTYLSDQFSVQNVEQHERPFQNLFFGVGYPVKPWWEAYSGALKSKVNFRLGAVCAAIQVGMTCALGYGKAALSSHTEMHWLQSLEWEAMILSAIFGGGIGAIAGTYKEWVRLGGELRQWIKLMSVGAVFGYIFMYFVKYDANLNAFALFDSQGNWLTSITLSSGAVVSGGILAHLYLGLNNVLNQFGKRELYEYAHMRREMAVDHGNHQKGILKGSSKSDSMMQLLYQLQYLTKIGDLGGVTITLLLMSAAVDVALGKVLLVSSVPLIQTWNMLWTYKMWKKSGPAKEAEWEKKHRAAVKRFWLLSGLPLLPIKMAFEAVINKPDSMGARFRSACAKALDRILPTGREPMDVHSPF